MSVLRSPYETHDYRGGLDSILVFYLLDKYGDFDSKWLEQFPGGNVVNRICNLLEYTHTTINFKAGEDARELRFMDCSFDGVLSHPPYWTAKKYSDDPRDLSNCASFEEFIQELGKTLDEAERVLRPGGFLIVIIGDVRKDRVLYPAHSDVIQYMKEKQNMVLRDILMWELSSSSTPFKSTKHMIQLNFCIIWEKLGHDARKIFE